MLATSFAIHDIRDAEGFVKATLKQSGIRFSAEQYEHMVAEGLAELVKLGDRFEPHREGYEHPGRFSGYAAKYLRLRLDRSWHKYMRSISVTDEEGKRRWEYRRPDEELSDVVLDTTPTPQYEGWSNADDLMDQAREHFPPGEVAGIEMVATMMAQGMSPRDIADAAPLGMRLRDVEHARGCLASAMTAIGVKR